MNDPATKLARHRLSVFELAAALGNVTAASRQAKMDRTSFYEYTRRFQIHSLAGLKDLPPIHHSHLATTPPEVVDQILAVASQYPTSGCVWISAQLKLRGVSVSSPSIQKIVHEHELGSRFERLLRLEAQALAETGTHPRPGDGHREGQSLFQRTACRKHPPRGELLCQDPFCVGHLKGTGNVYLQAVVDTCNYERPHLGYRNQGKRPIDTVNAHRQNVSENILSYIHWSPLVVGLRAKPAPGYFRMV